MIEKLLSENTQRTKCGPDIISAEIRYNYTL